MSEPSAAQFDAMLTAARSASTHASSAPWLVARELAAVEYLHATLGHDRFLPPIGGWSVDYSVVATVLDTVRQSGRSVRLLELGSGSGTPWFASVAHHAGGSLVTVEHDRAFVSKTSDLLEHYGLAGVAMVVHAPLIGDGDATPWYDPTPIREAIEDRPVDVLIVDGPPGDTGPHARAPALFRLAPYLADDALVVLDDVARSDEQRILETWLDAFGERLRRIPLLDGAAVLRVHGPAPPHTAVEGE